MHFTCNGLGGFMVPGPSSTDETQHNNLAPWRVLRGGVLHWIYVITSQSKNPASFVPSNNNNNTNWLFDLRFLGYFFKQQKRLLMKSERVPPLSTPSTLVFLCSPGSELFCPPAQWADLLFAERLFLSAEPSKNIKWEQMKHRNGDQFTEMCN